MNPGFSVSIFDLYEWLPSYGENSVTVDSKGLDLTIKVEYDSEDEHQTNYCRELKFNKVCAFYRTTLPGVSLFNPGYDNNSETPPMGSLIEYPKSEVAYAWNQHFGESRQIKHYKIIFLSDNISVEVFASHVTLGDKYITSTL